MQVEIRHKEYAFNTSDRLSGVTSMPFLVKQYGEIKSAMGQSPNEESVSSLVKLGFHYIVIGTRAYDVDVLL